MGESGGIVGKKGREWGDSGEEIKGRESEEEERERVGG